MYAIHLKGTLDLYSAFHKAENYKTHKVYKPISNSNCGRNILQYCIVDNKKITMIIWI